MFLLFLINDAVEVARLLGIKAAAKVANAGVGEAELVLAKVKILLFPGPTVLRHKTKE